jgi:hypothetical protein
MEKLITFFCPKKVTPSCSTLVNPTRIHSITIQQASAFLFLLGDTLLGRYCLAGDMIYRLMLFR